MKDESIFRKKILRLEKKRNFRQHYGADQLKRFEFVRLVLSIETVYYMLKTDTCNPSYSL